MGTTEQQSGLERGAVEELVQRFTEAWAARDPERVAACCTEDVVWLDPVAPEPLRGRADVVRFARATFAMSPDFEVVPTEPPYLSDGGARVLLPYRMRGTMTGPWELLDLAPTGRRYEISGIDSWEVRDGLIARYETFFDAMDSARQMGMMPEQGSAGERAFRRFQRRSAGA